MTMKPYIHFILVAFSCGILLSACSDDRQLNDLKNYVAQLKQKVTHIQKKELTAEFKLPQPISYRSASAAAWVSTSPPQGNGGGNPLQAYPLKLLQFVGTVTQNNRTWAYLMTPDKMIYQVKEGDIIGDSYGKIIKIDSEHIEVVQKKSATGSEANQQQVVTLQLKE